MSIEDILRDGDFSTIDIEYKETLKTKLLKILLLRELYKKNPRKIDKAILKKRDK